MKRKIGLRIIKTFLAVFLSLMIYVILLLFDKMFKFDSNSFNAPSQMYTPFFAGIAAAYATHRDTKSSLKQAKIRSIGSFIGGYFGMIIIYLFEILPLKLFQIDLNDFSQLLLFKSLLYLIVSAGVIVLISICIRLNTKSSVFITILTYLSVTVSIRNGGMPVFQFATNRILSTLIGVGISLLVNNIMLLKKGNNNIVFVSSLDNNFLEKGEISPFIKYKLNNLYYRDMNLVFASKRTMQSLSYIFEDINVTKPFIVMNGAATYDFNNNTYHNILHFKDTEKQFLENMFNKHNLNTFSYAIYDGNLYCYYNLLLNDGEKDYYQKRKEKLIYSFVRGKVLSDINTSLYAIISSKEKIDKLINEIKQTNFYNTINITVGQYEIDKFYHLVITPKNATKLLSLNKIYKDKEFIVCASQENDIELMEHSIFSICLSTAPDIVKSKADLVINANNKENILKVFHKLYYSKDYQKTISKLKKINTTL